MLASVRSWLQRHRRLALSLSALFLIFEASRAASIGQFLLPGWSEAAGARVESIFSHPPLVVATAASLALLFFAVPMSLAIYAALKIRRRLSRYWTGVNRLG
jgi:hypothetical protein